MGRFCKVFENKEGDQLLMRLEPSEGTDEISESLFDVVSTFETGDMIISFTIGGVSQGDAKKILEEYTQEKAEGILSDPTAFIEKLMS